MQDSSWRERRSERGKVIAVILMYLHVLVKPLIAARISGAGVPKSAAGAVHEGNAACVAPAFRARGA